MAEQNQEHHEDCLGGKATSHMREHAVLAHPESLGDVIQMFEMRSIKVSRKPLNRQVREAVEIQQDNSNVLLNRKEEFSRCILPVLEARGPPNKVGDERITVENSGLSLEQEESALLAAKTVYTKRVREDRLERQRDSKRLKLSKN